MIIVLRGADFSAENIGKVEFNLELVEDTKALLNIATKYPAAKENVYAQGLNKFVITLKDAGIYDKITTLVLPVMSASIEECSYNLINGAANPNTSYFTKLFALNEDNELYRTSESYTNEATHCAHTINHTYDNLCLFGYYNRKDGNGIDTIITARVNSWYGESNYLAYIADGPVGQIAAGGAPVLTATGSALLSGMSAQTSAFVINYDGTNVRFKNEKYDRSGSYSNPTKTGVLIGLYPLLRGKISAESQGSMLMYGCGSKLTADEVIVLYDAIRDFCGLFV